MFAGDRPAGWRMKFLATPCLRYNNCNDISVDNVMFQYCNEDGKIPNSDQVVCFFC